MIGSDFVRIAIISREAKSSVGCENNARIILPVLHGKYFGQENYAKNFCLWEMWAEQGRK